jgi:hypothetical protein
MDMGKKTPPPFYMYLLNTKKREVVVLGQLDAFTSRENLPQRYMSFAAGFCLVPPAGRFQAPPDWKRGGIFDKAVNTRRKIFELEPTNEKTQDYG